MTTHDENVPGRRRTNRDALIIVGVIVAALLLCIGCGAAPGDDRDDNTGASTSTTAATAPKAAPAPEPGPAVAPPPDSSTAAPTETTTAAAPSPTAANYSDPRCATASDELVAEVAAGLTGEGNRLANGTVIAEGGVTYFGATTVDAVGDMDSRSDVWIVRDGAVYSSTGGARGGSNFPRASEALGISPGDPIVIAVDTCVVDLTD